MKSTKREFALSAERVPGWYQIFDPVEVKKVRPKLLSVTLSLNSLKHIEASNNSSLLLQSMEKSQGIRDDLVLKFAQQLVKNPKFLEELNNISCAEEGKYRQVYLDHRVVNRLYESEPDNLEKYLCDIDYLRTFPPEAFRLPHIIEGYERNTKFIGDLSIILRSQTTPAEKIQKTISLIEKQWTDQALVSYAPVCGIHFGDEIQSDLPSPKKKTLFDVPKILMQHWPEFSRDENGEKFNCFIIKDDHGAKIFVNQDFVTSAHKPVLR